MFLSNRTHKLFLIVFFVLITSFSTSCLRKISSHGNLISSDIVLKMKRNSVTQEEVKTVFGNPTFISKIDDEIWSYSYQSYSSILFFKPKIIDQQIYSFTFNRDRLLKRIKGYTEKDINMIALSTTKIKDERKNLNPIKQILGNLGRFNGS